MEEKKYKSDLEMVREGSILKEYNIKKNFVNVTPAPTIGKVKISIVALNSGGKDYTDFILILKNSGSSVWRLKTALRRRKSWLTITSTHLLTSGQQVIMDAVILILAKGVRELFSRYRIHQKSRIRWSLLPRIH